LCSRSAVLGAVMNVQINMVDLEDKVWGNQVLSECKALAEKTESVENEVRKRVAEKVAE
jgi:formiminotetrahydrofolate cyclodeaminase